MFSYYRPESSYHLLSRTYIPFAKENTRLVIVVEHMVEGNIRFTQLIEFVFYHKGLKYEILEKVFETYRET